MTYLIRLNSDKSYYLKNPDEFYDWTPEPLEAHQFEYREDAIEQMRAAKAYRNRCFATEDIRLVKIGTAKTKVADLPED